MSQFNTAGAPAQNWVDGAWDGRGTVSASISPSTGQAIGTFTAADAQVAQDAIAAARAAFDAGSWSADSTSRARVLGQLADRLEARVPEIALMLAREGGKLLPQTMWELGGSVAWLRYSASTALLQNAGRAMEVTPGTYFHSLPEPMGVAGIISPWNSPIILTVRAIGPALAAGCTVVVKMPAQTALSNAMFAEVVATTHSLPKGVVNIFTEAGNVGAPLMVSSPDVDVISYTGSTQVGRRIAEAGGKTLKRLNLELGGKTPLMVFDDADLSIAVPTIIQALVAMNGQFCVTGSRILVHHAIADALRDALVAAYATIKLGECEDPDAQLGPLIDAASADRVDAIVAGAAAYGKILVRGGRVTDGPLAGGAFYRPSLIEVSSLDVPVVQEELFGPVQTFEIFTDEADAIRRANASDYGLATAIFTADAARARRVGRNVKAAIIWTNCWAVLSEHFEQGGYKQSGIGFLCGPRAIEQFQELKTYATTSGAQ